MFFLILVLFLPINYLFAEPPSADSQDSLRARRYQAMDKEMARVMAQREKIIEETLSRLAQNEQKERFFFTQRQNLALNPLEQNQIAFL